MEELLAALGEDDGLDPGPVLLLRHSERESLREASVAAALDAPLTPGGRALASRLGAALPTRRPVRLFHSPVSRCADTARIVAEAARRAGGRAEVLGPRDGLGAPFLLDPERAIERFAALGMAGFVRAWLAGEVPPDIAAPHAGAAGLLLGLLLRERATAPGALQIHVAHDLTVITLLGLGFPVHRPGFPWPGYLDGCLLSGTNPLRCRYHGETLTLDTTPQETTSC